MPLKDTNKKLYDDNSKIEKRRHSDSVFDLDYKDRNIKNDNNFSTKRSWWNKITFFKLNNETKKIILIGISILGVIAIFAGIIVGIYKFKQTAFAEDRVNISIMGNAISNSSKINEYSIEYENNNRTTLKNVEIILNYPESFYPEENNKLKKISDRSSKIIIGDIKSHSKGKVKIKGRFYAPENYTVYLQVAMRYTPSNFNSTFQVKSQLGVRVSNSPIELEIEAPKEALSESSITYIVKYKNNGNILLENLNLQVDYADGFIYQKAKPSPVSPLENGDIWHLGNLAAGSEGIIKIDGKVEGSRNDVKLVKVTIFANENNAERIVFNKIEGLTKIIVPPLTISHKINGQILASADLGDVLKYEINYANRGDVNLRDVIIKLKIDSPIIDYQRIKLNSGAFQDSDKTITWKASDIKKLQNLEPGASGTIILEIPLKKDIIVANSTDKNFSIDSIVTIDSSDIPHNDLGISKNISNEVLVKLNSRVTLNNQIYFNDDIIKNSGPIPPKVGEETTYTVHWSVSNLSNDISNTQVEVYLPTWVKWKSKIYPENENIIFNERTHKITWDIGKLLAGTGYYNPAKECRFQIGIVPEVNQVNKAINLLSETTLNATDNFTSGIATIKNRIKTTRIIDDKSVSNEGYLVIQ